VTISRTLCAATRLIALAASAFFLASFSAEAAENYYVFKSLLSTPSVSWCIDVPQDRADAHAQIAACSGKPTQTFGYEGGGSLTSGGYCLDALPGAPNQPPSVGDPVVITECTGADAQIWELQPFKRRADAFAISNPDGLCVTVGAPIADGAPLVLAQCAEQDNQGWLRSTAAAAGVAPEVYWYSGHRYCWYDGGWHGAGWYWCGENFHQGIGWGGPIGWHWWHHHGHPFHPHHPHPHPHPHPVLHPVLHPHFVPHPHKVIHPHAVIHPHVTHRRH
jgi:hypothetical protein